MTDVYIAPPFPAIPTVRELEAADDALRTQLLLLRCLFSSDCFGAASYMLLKSESILDIAKMAKRLLVITESESVPEAAKRQGLSADERKEYLALCSNLKKYVVAIS